MCSQCAQLRQENAYLRAVIHFFEKLISNPNLPGKLADVAYATWKAERDAAKKRPNDCPMPGTEGMHQVYRADIAKYSGVSEQTVSDDLKKLDYAQAIKKKIVMTCENGETKRELYLKTEVILERHPETIGIEGLNYGGKRIKKKPILEAPLPEECPDCQSVDLEPKPVVVCHTCGSVTRVPFHIRNISNEQEEFIDREKAYQNYQTGRKIHPVSVSPG